LRFRKPALLESCATELLPGTSEGDFSDSEPECSEATSSFAVERLLLRVLDRRSEEIAGDGDDAEFELRFVDMIEKIFFLGKDLVNLFTSTAA
jgi:hypothetical protein